MNQPSVGAAYVVGAAILSIPVLVVLPVALAIGLTALGLSPVMAHFVTTACVAVVCAILEWSA